MLFCWHDKISRVTTDDTLVDCVELEWVFFAELCLFVLLLVDGELRRLELGE